MKYWSDLLVLLQMGNVHVVEAVDNTNNELDEPMTNGSRNEFGMSYRCLNYIPEVQAVSAR